MACVYLCVFEISLVGVASGHLQLSVPVCLELGILVSVCLTAPCTTASTPLSKNRKMIFQNPTILWGGKTVGLWKNSLSVISPVPRVILYLG